MKIFKRMTPSIILCILSTLIFLSAPQKIGAGVTPGEYEIHELGGRVIGHMSVAWEPSTFENEPSTKMVIKSVLDQFGGDFEETEEVHIGKKGLLFFHRVTREGTLKSDVKGKREDDVIKVHRRDGKTPISVGIPLSTFAISEYELEMPHSPFFGMKLNEGKASRLFSIDKLKSAKVVRNINRELEWNVDGKETKVWQLNTNIENDITTSWFDVQTGRLLKEKRKHFILKRIEN